MNEEKGYTITDKRGMSENQEHPDEVCRVCGSKTVHTKNYGHPTTDCIKFLQGKIRSLEDKLAYHEEGIETIEDGE